MKKVFLALAIATACYSCGGGATEDKQPVSNNDANTNSQIGGDTSKGATATTTPAADSSATAAVTPAAGKDGKALIEASDCRTCHQDKVKVIGPAYTDVAMKYPATEANEQLLASKILAGGTGVWGQLPMVAHPNISKEDAVAMVKYILSMKK
jgi:cytochrome c